MSDESHVIRNINWREVFPFTNLFRSFRVAIHPSKLLLAMAALILIFVGGRVLDGLWPAKSRAVSREIEKYAAFSHSGKPGEAFAEERKSARKDSEAEYVGLLLKFKVVDKLEEAQRAAETGKRLGDLKSKILSERDSDVRNIEKEYGKALDEAKKDSDDQRRAERLDAAKRMRDQLILSIYDHAESAYQSAQKIENEGLFSQFFGYQTNQINNVARGVWASDWFSERGVVSALGNFLTIGPVWLMSQHPVYFILLGIFFLLVWAVFGGAISRIAAVHVARDEKISIRQALRFSVGKVVSFLFAPIIPLLIILVVGLLVTAGALLGNIPGIGSIIVGATFILALVAGFVMTLVLLGLAGGFNLMYPTIAVEGSDSFDAISRSFSYLYARPWRLAFYTAVSIAYGAVTYLFVRLFIYLLLVLTHKFVGLGIFLKADNTTPLWQALWPSPATTGRISYDVSYFSLGSGQSLGAFLISVWVFLIVAMLGAFAISFYFSASTIIYYLMRNEVDATELDDVYIEQTEDTFVEPTTPAVAATAPVATASVASTDPVAPVVCDPPANPPSQEPPNPT